MNAFKKLWKRLAKSKRYREEFVAAQVKRGIPFQVRELIRRLGISQEELASRAGLTQGAVSRAANIDYGNLTLNTIIRVAAGFDVAFVGKFVPFSELGNWFIDLPDAIRHVKTFNEENAHIGPLLERQPEDVETSIVSLPSFNCEGILDLTAFQKPLVPPVSAVAASSNNCTVIPFRKPAISELQVSNGSNYQIGAH